MTMTRATIVRKYASKAVDAPVAARFPSRLTTSQAPPTTSSTAETLPRILYGCERASGIGSFWT